jgi:putative colanic acid biosynthesis UDP-glucose lipid carrier transferase
VFLGNDPANLIVYNELMADPATGYRVLGYYSDSVIENAPDSLPKIGSRDDFRKWMENYHENGPVIEELYCSLSHSEADEMRHIMEFCDKNVVRFFYVPRIFSNIQLSLRPEKFGDTVIFTNHHEPLQHLGNRVVKRLFDIVFSAIVLLMLFPLFPIMALIIKMQSKGPVFFKQMRTGLNGDSFMCYKFRSMHVNADADRVQATKHDPRKFPFGEFMRKTNLDELPQFFNVLKGDMSVVGPRPHMIFHTEKYSALIDKYMVRHFSKPGITGYAQVTGFRGETEELWQMEGRIRKDIWYIENWSMWLDIKIIFMTALSIVRPDKAAY